MTVLRVPVLSEYEWQKSVKTTLISAPTSPNNGDRYIIGSVIDSEDVWYNHDGEIAQYISNDWEFLEPFPGIIIYLTQDDKLLKYTNKWEYLVATLEQVQVENSGKVLTHDDLGKCFTCENIEEQIFYLPIANFEHIGGWVRFIKLGSGKLSVEAGVNDIIADSGVGDTLYNDQANQNFATVTIMIAAVGKWVINGGHGTWITTD